MLVWGMKKHIGLWIDHRKAEIVDGDEVQIVLSGADKQPGRVEGVKSTAAYEALQAPADDVRDRKFEKHLNQFYDEVVALVHGAESLLVFGPGEAKGEFRKRLEKEKPGGRTVVVETADKMTQPQIVAKVREHFKRLAHGAV